MRMKIGLIINIFLLSISFSQAPCILGEVYVSEAANAGDDYIEVYNGGSEECTLEGFQLDDSEELEDFTFGNVILSAGDYWIGYEDSTDSFNSGLGGEGTLSQLYGRKINGLFSERIERKIFSLIDSPFQGRWNPISY